MDMGNSSWALTETILSKVSKPPDLPPASNYNDGLLGGPCDLVITYNWAYNRTYNPPKWAYRGYPNSK